MKNKENRISAIKHQLLEKKHNGVKEVIWKLTNLQREFVETSLGFYTEEYLYRIQTKKFYNIKDLDNLLKKIHYLNKKGKKYTVLKLTPYQKKLLNEYCVNYKPYKFRIVLNR